MEIHHRRYRHGGQAHHDRRGRGHLHGRQLRGCCQDLLGLHCLVQLCHERLSLPAEAVRVVGVAIQSIVAA